MIVCGQCSVFPRIESGTPTSASIKKILLNIFSILPSYVFLSTTIIILLLTCPISSQIRLKSGIEEKSIKDRKKF
ncbi:hypothetical protein COE15_13705 [Bacillus cereus]|nr:hypothetical protein CN288_07660 [Bacillus sp. AFS023182]PGY00377.1 hypothetical protein COE15_13705 [Bacillus cereus]